MRFASVFSDHAVLQRDQPIPVWGITAANQDVSVRLAGKQATVRSGADGSWLVRLPPLPAGGPFELVATAASGTAQLQDVLIGDVWICSGQSNMQMTLTPTAQSLSVAALDLPRIRLLTVNTPARLGRQSDVTTTWQLGDHATFNAFSAVGGWFGQALQRRLDVPIGLICNAWGGTRVQAWMSREALLLDPAGIDEVRGYESFAYAPAETVDIALSPAAWEKHQQQRDVENLGLAQGWHTAGFADTAWPQMPVPSRWQDHGHPGSGVVWFRRTVTIPAAWIGRDLELHLGAIDKHDETWVEGQRVGGLSWADGPSTWCQPRIYRVAGANVTGTSVTVAVRARSHVFHGGMTGPEHEMRLHPLGETAAAVPLAGDWRYIFEQDWGVQTPPQSAVEPGSPNSPYTLFDSRLAPLIPYGIRGAIWYQGESNAHEAALYRRLLPQMIADWRRAFGQGNFPFLQVQLANYMPTTDVPRASEWAMLREAQLATALEDPAGGIAIAIDVGQGDDIHPLDKRSVGERLARWALAMHYGLGGIPSGPLFTNMTVESEGRVRCHFRHASGLSTHDGQAPRQVAIAGVDRVFVWANAVIDGETLVAWHPKVPRPYALRYAWANNPDTCNVVGVDNLPAAPFRTDSW